MRHQFQLNFNLVICLFIGFYIIIVVFIRSWFCHTADIYEEQTLSAQINIIYFQNTLL